MGVHTGRSWCVAVNMPAALLPACGAGVSDGVRDGSPPPEHRGRAGQNGAAPSSQGGGGEVGRGERRGMFSPISPFSYFLLRRVHPVVPVASQRAGYPAQLQPSTQVLISCSAMVLITCVYGLMPAAACHVTLCPCTPPLRLAVTGACAHACRRGWAASAATPTSPPTPARLKRKRRGTGEALMRRWCIGPAGDAIVVSNVCQPDEQGLGLPPSYSVGYVCGSHV